MEAIQKRVFIKRKQLKEVKIRALAISQFLYKNKFVEQTFEEEQKRFALPCIMVANSAKMLIELEKNYLKVSSKQPFQIISDFECMKLLKYPFEMPRKQERKNTSEQQMARKR